MNSKSVVVGLGLVVVFGSFAKTTSAQEYSLGSDLGVVSKYIWRGQNLTNDLSLQPSVTLAVAGFPSISGDPSTWRP